jgi:hypothetical protein
MKIFFVLALFMHVMTVCAQNSDNGENVTGSSGERDFKSNLLYINPMHLSRENLTLSYEKFIGEQKSYKIILSGSDKANYILVEFDANYYTAKPASINYFLGLALFGYESPIVTGVPVYHPFNKFSESEEDIYSVGLQVKNGLLFRISKVAFFEMDIAFGPSYNLTEKKWLAVWGINLNLGVPF